MEMAPLEILIYTTLPQEPKIQMDALAATSEMDDQFLALSMPRHHRGENTVISPVMLEHEPYA